MTIVVRTIFLEKNKYYADAFLDKCKDKLSKDKLKEIDITNRTCYYFDDVIKDIDVNFSNILSDEKLYENTSVYDISYKSSTGPKLLRIK